MTQTMTIASFNMASGLNPDLEKLANFLKTMSCDFIGLQEVDEKTGRFPHPTSEILGKALNMTPYFSEAMPFMAGSYGITLLSKTPILTSSATFFETHGEEPRVYQEITTEIGAKKIHIYNTHLSFETPNIRQKQMAQLQKDLKEPLLLVGDFNTDQSVLEWEDFSLNFSLANGKNHQWLDTFMEKDPSMKTNAIDNIIYSSEFTLEKLEVIPTPLSDHALLKGTFTLQ